MSARDKPLSCPLVFALRATPQHVGNAGGLQILRCQGFEVKYYDFTLDALTLKPSDVCNVGVNSRRLCDFSNVKDTVRPYRNFCSDFFDDVVWFFFCFKSRLMAKCHLFQGIVSIPLGDRSYGPGGEVTFYPQMLPLNDMQHFVKVNNVLICQISAYKNSVFPGNALNTWTVFCARISQYLTF